MKRNFKKYLIMFGLMAVTLTIALPTIAAFEGHLIDVKAHTELSDEMKWKWYCGYTRTPGYWGEHLQAAYWALNELLVINPQGIDLGWRNITNIGELMAVFHASTSEQTTLCPYGNPQNPKYKPCQRDDLCKARLKCAQQALAAILTAITQNGTYPPVSLAEIQDTMLNGTVDEINDLKDILDAHNNSNVTGTLGIPGGIENIAEPQLAITTADPYLSFVDCP